MKFKKKPVIIEAVQIKSTDYNPKTLSFDGCPFSEVPEWLSNALKTNIIHILSPNPKHPDYAEWEIETLEGNHIASAGDWIIRGVKGEFYPVKNDIFELTYEKVEE